MTADAALKEIARQELRFEEIGFKNGLMLAKSYPPAKGCPEGGLNARCAALRWCA